MFASKREKNCNSVSCLHILRITRLDYVSRYAHRIMTYIRIQYKIVFDQCIIINLADLLLSICQVYKFNHFSACWPGSPWRCGSALFLICITICSCMSSSKINNLITVWPLGIFWCNTLGTSLDLWACWQASSLTRRDHFLIAHLKWMYHNRSGLWPKKRSGYDTLAYLILRVYIRIRFVIKYMGLAAG